MPHASPRLPALRHALATLLLAATLTACTDVRTSSSEQAVRQLWSEYLASRQGRFAANAGTPSPLWSASEQAQWPMYDLAGFYVPDQSIPEVLRIAPVDTAADSAYQIVTQFWPASPAARDSSTMPLLTMTVYARRENGRWVLANALPYLTSSWRRETRGRISYHVAPALRFDSSKADRAAAFVDSLAAAFDVSAPERIDYFVTESVDQALEILGADFPQQFGAAGGFSKPVNAQVFSGIPALGEDYRHELAHVVLLPVLHDVNTSLLASEGVPTWFGGTAGRDFQGSVRHLDSLLNAQPQLTLDVIVDSAGVNSDVRNAAGAVLADMLNDTGGADAVRAFLRTPGYPRTIRAELERLLQQPWAAIVAQWRRRVDRIADA